MNFNRPTAMASYSVSPVQPSKANQSPNYNSLKAVNNTIAKHLAKKAEGNSPKFTPCASISKGCKCGQMQQPDHLPAGTPYLIAYLPPLQPSFC